MSTILCQVFKIFDVLIHTVGPLLKIQQFPLLAVHDVGWNVVPTECPTELIPQDLVVVLRSSGVRGPLGTCGPTELLGCKLCLLERIAVKQSELRLSHVDPVISFKQVCHLSEN
jgi:hypothetical protein